MDKDCNRVCHCQELKKKKALLAAAYKENELKAEIIRRLRDELKQYEMIVGN